MDEIDSKGTVRALSAFEIASDVEGAQIQLGELTALLLFCAANADCADREDGEPKFVGQVLTLGRAIELQLLGLKQAVGCVYDMAGTIDRTRQIKITEHVTMGLLRP